MRAGAEAVEVEQPSSGTYSSEPGPRGCHTRRANGELCAAVPLRGRPFCKGHSGGGFADPAAASAKGHAVQRENARRRAALRLVLGDTRSFSARGALRAQTVARAAEIASRTVDAVLDPDVPAERAARLALDLVEAVEPRAELVVSTPLPSSVDDVSELGLRELLALSQQHSIPLPAELAEPAQDTAQAQS